MANTLLFGRVIKVTINTSDGYLNFNNDDLEIHFEINFDDDEKPNVNTVSIYNLTKTTIGRIKKEQKISVTAGYKADYGLLVEGKIAGIKTSYENEIDKLTKITFAEGTSYTSKKTPKAITFRKGTTGKQIISKLTGLLGIKPATVSIPKNKVYKSGYKVTGQIENNLVEVVKDCGASMYWRRGRMVIRSIKTGDDERFTLSEDTGLIEPPESFDDDNGKGYTVRCLLQHRITTASIIQLKSSTANGTFRVRSGKHYCDGSDFLSEFEVI
ncbi:hypothetical protein HH307_02985 [Bacillus coagulans]|nr:hypothetical protein [Heyndrickxia coagulans]NMH83263.1 hypothetical protein [Heyndrickxia coagulans]